MCGSEREQQRKERVLWEDKIGLPCFVRDHRRRPRTLNWTINGPKAVVVADKPSMEVESNLAGPPVATGFREILRHGKSGVFVVIGDATILRDGLHPAARRKQSRRVQAGHSGLHPASAALPSRCDVPRP